MAKKSTRREWTKEDVREVVFRVFPGAPTIADVRDYWNRSHPRPRDQPRGARFAGVLRRSRSVPLREAAPPAAAGGLRRLSRQARARRRLRRRHRSGPLRAGRRDRQRRRSLAVGDRAGAAELRATGARGGLREADGEHLPYPDDTFDLVFAHGVVQYTPTAPALVDECRRVLKPGGEAMFQVYNRISWLNALSKVMKVPLEHEDAPVLGRLQRVGEFRAHAHRLPRRANRRGAVSGEVAAPWRLEGSRVQHLVRRDVQRPAARSGPALRLAPARVLPQMKLIKTHAFGNDFLLVAADQLPPKAERAALTRAVCERHRGIGADGLIFYTPTPSGAAMGLLNADGSYSEVSGNGVRCLAAWIAARPAGFRRDRDRHGCRRQAPHAARAERLALHVPRVHGPADEHHASATRAPVVSGSRRSRCAWATRSASCWAR